MIFADMAELADAPVLGAGGLLPVQVRTLLSALIQDFYSFNRKRDDYGAGSSETGRKISSF